MFIDLHVHTSRYSGCARNTPEEMVTAAIAAGLDGMVITEHEVMWERQELAALQSQFPQIKLFRGVEITNGYGDDFLIYGVDDPRVYSLEHGIANMIQSVQEAGGAVTLAHPFRFESVVPDGVYERPVDAVEVMSGNMVSYMDEKVTALWRELGATAVSNSDGHLWDRLGCFGNLFWDEIADERALAAAIRAGRCSLYVDPARMAQTDLRYRDALPVIERLLAVAPQLV